MNALRIDHTAVVVADLDEALPRFERLYGTRARGRQVVAQQGVEVVFVPVGDTQIELVQPLGEDSGVARFLERHGEALHHIGVLVQDIHQELANLKRQGVELIDSTPRPGVHGLIAFVHPRGSGGVLVELVEHEGGQTLQA